MDSSEKSTIEQLPNEILLRVLLYLPQETIKKCYYVSKKFNKVLKESVHYLPKFSITKYVVEDKGNSISIHMEKSSFNSPKKVWTTQLVYPSEENRLPGEALDVAEFYRSKGLTGLKWNAANKSVYTAVPDIIEAFEEHLTFICRKARFTILQLVSIRPAIVNLTKNVFKKCNSGAINLKLVLNRPLDVDHINLIRDTTCETIDIWRDPQVNVNVLFDHPSIIRDVWSINILQNSNSDSSMNTSEKVSDDILKFTDNFLLAVNAEYIDVKGRTLVTPEGIKNLIMEHLTGRRKIESMSIGLQFPEAPTDPKLRKEYLQSRFDAFNNDPLLEKTDKQLQWKVAKDRDQLWITFNDDEYFYISRIQDEETDYPDSE